MPQQPPADPKVLEEVLKVAEKGAAPKSGAKNSARAENAATTKKWAAKEAPPAEKKAMEAVKKVIEKACPQVAMKDLGGAARKAGRIKRGDLQKFVKEAEAAQKEAKKQCAPLPQAPRQAVEKEVEKAFKEVMNFWKEVEANAKKKGVDG